MTCLTFRNLKYRYPHQEKLALDSLSFTIKKGEFVGLIGANGAGKSTLCGAVMGLVPHFYKGAYGGKILLGGEDEADAIEVAKTPIAELCRSVGLVFQNPFNQLSGARITVYEEIAFGLQNIGIAREEIRRRIEAVMELLDIVSLRDRNPFDLSGGQMQRVALASVLVMEPEILVLDEPTSQLDPAAGEEVFRAVETLKASGITIIMAEQKMEKLAAYCDRIILLHQGKIVDFDTPDQIFSRDDLSDYGICPPLSYLVAKKGAEQLDVYGWKPHSSRDSQDSRAAQDPRAARDSWFPEEIFAVRNLSFSYVPELPVLTDLCLGLDNRTTAIVGQNGAGKTTLVKLLKGLLSPVSGSIWYRKEDISGKTVAMLARDIGYVFQNPDDQIFKYHVLDEVMFGPLHIGMEEQLAKTRALEALETVGLTGLEEVNPYDLELHERKMVAVASVLAMDTAVLILDEPTIAQDYRGRETLKRLIRQLEGEGKAVLSILHDMDFVYDCFERVIVLAAGKVMGDAGGEVIFRNKELLKQAGLEQPAAVKLRNLRIK